VCLFSVLNELKDDLGITLHAVHVNHGFRPGAADEDQKYVETLCAECGVESTSFLYDCNAIAEEHGLSSEEAGRKVRYESFLKIAAELVQKGIPEEKIKIAVAHNADDQAETVLFRLLRGTGTDGLAGMAYSRMEKNICVIRPLLDTWREDIEAYCAAQGLNTRTDHTNLQPIYTRNKIRLDLIPYLQDNFNANIMETLGRLSRIADMFAETERHLTSQVQGLFEGDDPFHGAGPEYDEQVSFLL
jgi:tRNA(Ile)-lysidine synthase